MLLVFPFFTKRYVVDRFTIEKNVRHYLVHFGTWINFVPLKVKGQCRICSIVTKRSCPE